MQVHDGRKNEKGATRVALYTFLIRLQVTSSDFAALTRTVIRGI